MTRRHGPSAIVLGPAHDPRASATHPPLVTRRRIAHILEEEGVPAVLMEDEPQDPDETHTGLFLRLLHERDVRTFILFWPPDAHLHGVDVELGFLLTEMHRERLEPACVHVLAHASVVNVDGWDPDGDLTWQEHDNRTAYHHDLFAYGCAIHRWHNERDLEEAVRGVARRHRARSSMTDPAT